MRKIIGVILFACILFGLFQVTVACGAEGINNNNQHRYSYLILGFDDAHKNTDAIVIASYNTASNEASFLQIPRDTLVVYRGEEKKLNSIYPGIISTGKDGFNAAKELCSFISDALGLQLDGFAGFSVGAFARLIDHIGGIDIEIPYDFVYNNEDGDIDISIPRGKHHLSGEEAVRFVRYRRGYSIGDLGRLDAQKLFISAFVTKLKSSINPATAFRMICDSGEGVITDIRLMDILRIALKKNGSLVDAGIRYASLPGQAAISNKGISYYVCNKAGTDFVLQALDLGSEINIKSLCPIHNNDFITIFNSININPRIYDDAELTKIVIPGG